MQDCTVNLVKNVEQIKDGRRRQGKRYSCQVIVWILILGLLHGCHNLLAIYDLFTNCKELKELIAQITKEELKDIPHPTTISRALQKCDWDNFLRQLCLDQSSNLEDLVIAVDGKVMRGIHNGSNRHILSLVNQQNQLVMQGELDTKENEITALKKLLQDRSFHLPKGTIFTGDALFTQGEIIKQLQKRQADYIFKVKDNQKELKSELAYIFHQGLFDQAYPLKIDQYSQSENKHDRDTTWKIITSQDFDSQDLPLGFQSVKTIGFISTHTKRSQYDAQGHKSYVSSNEIVFFVSSLDQSAKELFSLIRGHWRIENNLHWLKDTLYREDSQTLTGKPAHFFTLLKSLTIGLLHQISSRITATTRKISHNFTFLLQTLQQLGIMM
jgi:predicted transposase YbfD/YdcC